MAFVVDKEMVNGLFGKGNGGCGLLPILSKRQSISHNSSVRVRSSVENSSNLAARCAPTDLHGDLKSETVTVLVKAKAVEIIDSL